MTRGGVRGLSARVPESSQSRPNCDDSGTALRRDPRPLLVTESDRFGDHETTVAADGALRVRAVAGLGPTDYGNVHKDGWVQNGWFC